jgi:integrase
MKSVSRVKGIKRYRHPKTGITYCYHRKSGQRILAAFNTPEFHIELAAIEKSLKIIEPAAGSLGLLIKEYRNSPNWGILRPHTQLSYERVFHVLKPLEDMPLVQIDRPFLIALRDKKLLSRHKRWMANYAITVLSIVFRFGADRGLISSNPLSERVTKIRASRDQPIRNRPWTEDESRIVMELAPPQLLLPLALAMFAGFRKADFLTVTLSAVKDGKIGVRTSKRGVPVMVPIHPILQQAMEVRPKSSAVTIAVNSRGEPWTETGFNASYAKFRGSLERKGLVAAGLTPHGLRHTLATRLRESGADDRTIADILGQKSVSMARMYSENAALPEAAIRLLLGLNLTGQKNKT